MVDDDVGAWHGHAEGNAARDDVGVGDAADGLWAGLFAGVVAVDVEQGFNQWVIIWNVVHVFGGKWVFDAGAVACAQGADDGINIGAAWVAEVDDDVSFVAVIVDDAGVDGDVAHDVIMVGDAQAFAVKIFM